MTNLVLNMTDHTDHYLSRYPFVVNKKFVDTLRFVEGKDINTKQGKVETCDCVKINVCDVFGNMFENKRQLRAWTEMQVSTTTCKMKTPKQA